MTASSEQLRLSITLSGGASLGAYQAGAMASLLVASRRLRELGDDRVRVDAVGGASAGALVALFSAHALLEGLDPVALLREAWVERISLGLLRSEGGRAPLDFDGVRRGLCELVGANGGEPQVDCHGPRQETPIALHVSLTGLQGLTYPIRAMRRSEMLTAVTYADWGRFVLEPGGGPDALFEPEGTSLVDFVLASAAHPGGFAPRLLDRTSDAEGYRQRGIADFPESGRLWYSDGGLVQIQPLGRVLANARRLEMERIEEETDADRPSRRIHLMIDARSENTGGDRWVDPDLQPSWTEGLSRVLAIVPQQILYEDLRRLEKTNTRLQWAEALVDALEPHLGEGAEEALETVLESIDSDRDKLPSDEPTLDVRERGGKKEPARRRKLRRVVDEIGGLVHKEEVHVDLISPLLLAGETEGGVPALLAGEFMGDFGGFLRRDLRHSDFALGYASGLVWMRHALVEADFEDETVDDLLAHVEDCGPGDWRELNRGLYGLEDLPWGGRLSLARFGVHALRVLAAEVVGDRADGLKAAGRVVGNALQRPWRWMKKAARD